MPQPLPVTTRPHVEDYRYIWVAGLHRSGTSLLHRIIRDHPEVTGLKNTGVPADEGQHLQSVYPIGRRFGGPGRFALHPDAYMDERHPLVSRSNAKKILGSWAPYLDLSKEYIVEKSPPNIIRSRFLQALFPRSKFVFVLRHPLAVSYATQKWSKSSIKSLMEHSLHAFERLLDDLPHLEHAYVLRYEEFVADPGRESEKLFEFLSLKAVPIRQKVFDNVNQKYFAAWREDEAEESQALVTPILKKLPEDTESRLKSFGYSLDPPERLLPASYAIADRD